MILTSYSHHGGPARRTDGGATDFITVLRKGLFFLFFFGIVLVNDLLRSKMPGFQTAGLKQGRSSATPSGNLTVCFGKTPFLKGQYYIIIYL